MKTEQLIYKISEAMSQKNLADFLNPYIEFIKTVDPDYGAHLTALSIMSVWAKKNMCSADFFKTITYAFYESKKGSNMQFLLAQRVINNIKEQPSSSRFADILRDVSTIKGKELPNPTNNFPNVRVKKGPLYVKNETTFLGSQFLASVKNEVTKIFTVPTLSIKKFNEKYGPKFDREPFRLETKDGRANRPAGFVLK